MNTDLDEFKLGCQNAIPICLGYIAVSFVFGIEAVKIGMSVFQAGFTSLVNVTSAGQFSALDIIVREGSYIELIILQLIVNLRYLLMSCALSQKLDPSVTTLQRLLISYGVTDEVFALSFFKKGSLRPAYSYGLILVSVFGWVLGTVLGAISGKILPHRLLSCLGLAIYGMFIAIIIPDTRKSKGALAVVLSAMTLATVFNYVPVLASHISSGFRIIIITIVVAAAAAIIWPVEPERKSENADGDATKGEV